MTEAVIDIQPTPNPNAAKFTLDRVVSPQGRTYKDPAAADAEWAKRILTIPGVMQVFTVNNFISITKSPQISWEELVPQVSQVLNESFT